MWKKLLFGLVALALLVGGSLAVKFFSAEVEVAESKNAWEEEFKNSFVASCSALAENSILKKMGQDKVQDIHKTLAQEYGAHYCQCISNKLEATKLVATKYNAYRGIASYQSEMNQAIDGYMASEQGKKDAEECNVGSLEFIQSKFK